MEFNDGGVEYWLINNEWYLNKIKIYNWDGFGQARNSEWAIMALFIYRVYFKKKINKMALSCLWGLLLG